MKKPRIFSLSWVFEPLEDHPTFFTKKMFGSLAVYYNGKMVLVLSESQGVRDYRGKTYPFDIWNGLLLPTDREHHSSLLSEFPSLSNHVVLPKWLYIPQSHKDFEKLAETFVDRIVEGDERFGIVAQPK